MDCEYWAYREFDDALIIGEEKEGGGWYIEFELNNAEPFSFLLFEIPMYGGKPVLYNSYESLKDAISAAKSLT